MRPLTLDTKWVRPLDTDPGICMTCAKPIARWAIGKPPSGYLSCARCFLYTSPWGQENVDQIGEFVANVEDNMGRILSLDGILIENEADRILSSIVTFSRLSNRGARREVGNEGSGA